MSKKRLTKGEKRVAIAKDVIKQIKAHRFAPTQQVYISKDRVRSAAIELNLPDQAQDCVLNLKRCEACAVGSMFLSSIGLYNDYTLEKFNESKSEDYFIHLSKFFSREELYIIEDIFEETRSYDNFKLNKCGRDPEEILLKIMRHIIRNKGKFKPGKVYHEHLASS